MEENLNIENIEVKEELRIVFMGTPDFARCVLEGICSKYNVRAIVTQPDKEVGRKKEIKISPVKEYANDNLILCLQPEHIKDATDEIISLKPNMIITCAYGQILPRELLVMPKYGCINVHASLLPLLRGGAPIQRSIMEGHKKTGITIMHMSPYMDEGDIIVEKEIPILDDDNYTSLNNKLSIVGRDLLLEVIPQLYEGTAPRKEQDSTLATYAPIIKKEDERIVFSKTTRQIVNQIRGLSDVPGAYCMFEGKRVKVFKAYATENSFNGCMNGEVTAIYKDGFGVKVENGEVVFTEIQIEGKQRMSASSYINGLQNKDKFIGRVFE